MIDPHVFFGYDEITANFDVAACTTIDGDYLEQKKPKPRSPFQNLINTFDLVSWTFIAMSLILLSVALVILAKIRRPNMTVSL